jgi:L-histidine Nalpha-methyltransferase
MIESPATARRSFGEDVLHGLTRPQKTLPPWYFYDALGSALFSAICELPEYYLTRAETEVLTRHAAAIARALGGAERIIELGSGDARKTRLLFDALPPAVTYVPIDVDAGVLSLPATFERHRVEPIQGDYRDIGSLITAAPNTAVLFLGSSIGNYDALSAAVLLRGVRRVLVRGNALLLGADLKKPVIFMERAYADPLGVTACFNLNLLARINRELGGQFDLAAFEHRAFFNEQESRIEMHLVSRRRQSVIIDALRMAIDFEAGETIHTENSYEYSEAGLQTLARESGFDIEQIWTDSRGWFADALFVAR